MTQAIKTYVIDVEDSRIRQTANLTKSKLEELPETLQGYELIQLLVNADMQDQYRIYDYNAKSKLMYRNESIEGNVRKQKFIFQCLVIEGVLHNTLRIPYIIANEIIKKAEEENLILLRQKNEYIAYCRRDIPF